MSIQAEETQRLFILYKLMTQKELEDLVGCYVHVEGYTDLRSIYSILCQEYPDEFDKKTALEIIRKVLKEERES